MTTLDELKRQVFAGAAGGVECPVCGQLVKIYNRSFNSGMARCLSWLYTTRGDWVHVPSEAPDTVLRSREFDKLDLWGVAERRPTEDGTKRESGVWKITPLGVEFVEGKVSLPRSVRLFHGKALDWATDEVSFQDALKNPFNYSTLMQSQTINDPLFTKLVAEMGEGWARLLYSEFKSDDGYLQTLMRDVVAERKRGAVYPESENVFRAFRETPLETVKVVIIGQDPYHTPGKADGLAFSIPEGYEGRLDSLGNILKEVESDIGFKDPVPNTDLSRWAEQGVLLLNTTLTVRKGEAGSHAGLAGGAWPRFTRAVVRRLAEHYSGQLDIFDPDSPPKRQLVFLLWGAHARSLMPEATSSGVHLVFDAAHPSPFSAHKGFFGTKPFSKANHALTVQGLAPIDWAS